LHVSPIVLDMGIAQFDLSVEWEESAEGLAGFVEYSTDLFEAPTIQKLAERYQELMEKLAAEPDCAISELVPDMNPAASSFHWRAPELQPAAASPQERLTLRRAQLDKERAHLSIAKQGLLEKRLKEKRVSDD
jgi:non-ribosomal peptide synthetase component F